MPGLSAADVAAELRRRLPGVGDTRLHKLLYYCQGQHLAAMAEPLFPETISAWDMGPVVGSLWKQESDGVRSGDPAHLDEAALNTVGYEVSRYGSLSARDLVNLTHAEAPWLEANAGRPPRTSRRIVWRSIEAYFRSESTDDDDLEAVPDADTVEEFLTGALQRLSGANNTDSLEQLSRRLGA